MPMSSFRRRLAASVVCLASVAVPSVASAATPGAVSVRVEGASATLVPRTTVTTTTAPVDKGNGHPCSGTSAGGALQQATAGEWSGPYTFAQIVETIKGESHPFSGPDYWALYVNGEPADLGACDTELQPGDSVLFFNSCTSGTSGCFSGEPLAATAPATAAPGAPFTVTVTQATTTYAPDYSHTTTKSPAAGATVSGGGLTGTTGADGKATLSTATRGPVTLVATKGGEVRDSVTVCVTDGADGFCGTTKPGDPPPPPTTGTTPTTPPPPCQTTGSDGLCGSPDKTAPVAAIRGGLKEKAVFTRAKAPSTLAGSVAADTNGLEDVRLRLTRRIGPHCSYLDGERERLVKSRVCGVAGGRFFSIGDKADWSYLLPFALPAGRYVLDVQTVDRAGNVSKISARGRDRIVFVVK